MVELSAGAWTRALERISRRHDGTYVVVRVYEGAREPAGVVLWHTPLRGICLLDDNTVEIRAGDPVAPIVYVTKPVQTIYAEFSDDREHVRQLRFETVDGDRTVMEFGR